MSWEYYRVTDTKHNTIVRIDKSKMVAEELMKGGFKTVDYRFAKILCRPKLRMSYEEAFVESI